MKNIWSIIIGILAIINIIYSFWNATTIESIFGIEMNIWVYRLIWSVITIASLYDYYKKKMGRNLK